MAASSLRPFVRRWRTEYKKLKPVYSKLLHEKVVFSALGFDHLLHKNSRLRPHKVIKDRLPLIPLISDVILDNPILMSPRKLYKTRYGIRTEFTQQTFQNKVAKKRITVRVVVERMGDKGEWQFLSIYRK